MSDDDMLIGEARLAFLDVETTGLFPAMGDRIVEIGIVICRGTQETGRLSRLVNPERLIPTEAQQVHGISDQDVADCPPFSIVADEMCNALRDTWIVGHNVRFDIGFVAMEIVSGGHHVTPLGCLDTCQLAAALWDLPNYQLDTVVAALALGSNQPHRALGDAELARAVFHRAVEELGGWPDVTLADLQALHSYVPAWPDDPRQGLPGPLFDALTNGGELSIGYINSDGQQSARTICPVACFPAGRYTYVRAHCNKTGELRTFRIDRMVLERWAGLAVQPVEGFKSDAAS
ncbi:MAG: exonuclease domain-containing protein [Planctomycetota bacterium]